jgi:hypothetical protein
MSVSAYDPLYIDLWRDGGTKGVELSMPKNDAVALRHRLYRLRAAMLKESHPLAETAERGSVSIKFAPKADDNWIGYSTDKQMTRVCVEQGWEPKALRWKLCIYPPDARFADALAAAGYKSDLPPPLD